MKGALEAEGRCTSFWGHLESFIEEDILFRLGLEGQLGFDKQRDRVVWKGMQKRREDGVSQELEVAGQQRGGKANGMLRA